MMLTTPSTSPSTIAPPQWTHRLLRACLPDAQTRDAILGDLHEELARDAERMEAPQAQARHRRRVMGIVAYAAIDALRSRPWVSERPSVGSPAAALPAGGAVAARPARIRGADFGTLALAFGVLMIGIVANTALFGAMGHRVQADGARGIANSVVGIASLALALASAGIAALVICLGPRWLRTRARRQLPPRNGA